MNYLLKPKPPKRSNFTGALIVALCVALVMFVLFFGGRSRLVSLFGSLAAPAWKTHQTAASFFAGTSGLFRDTATLIDENLKLKKENEELRIRSLERDALQFELDAIKGFTLSEGEIGRVLSSPSQSFYDSILIELPADSSVREGDRVFAPPAVALGEVSSRRGSFAQVTLFSSPGRQTFARLLKDGTELLLQGRGSGNFSVAVPRALSIAPGDLISAPYLQSNILARVAEVEEARTESFKQVYLSYPVNVFSLSWVRIIHVSES